MKKSIKITIPEPCHEDWNKMTPTEQGKFCAQCSKEVFDFTNASDEELYKKVQAGASLCGRFKKDQLDREIKLERKKGHSLLPYAASLILPASILTTNIAEAKVETKPMISLDVGVHSEKAQVTITGYITDSHGIPINNAEVIVLETSHSVRTGPDGYYQIKCVGGSRLIFQKKDLASEEKSLGNYNAQIDITLTLPPAIIVAPGTEKVSMALGRFSAADSESNSEIKENTEKKTLDEIADSLYGDVNVSYIQDLLENKVAVCNLYEETKISEVKEDSIITIKGTVTDDRDLPFAGVNIVEKGTTNGVQTDFDGNYLIKVNSGAILDFSYIGYLSNEVNLANISNTIDVKMESEYTEFMGEVIFTRTLCKQETEIIPNPYAPRNGMDDIQRQNRTERQAYSKKVLAFKKVKAARAKAARLLKKKKKK